MCCIYSIAIHSNLTLNVPDKTHYAVTLVSGEQLEDGTSDFSQTSIQ